MKRILSISFLFVTLLAPIVPLFSAQTESTWSDTFKGMLPQGPITRENYFNKAFLQNYPLVNADLVRRGFKRVAFLTPVDHLTLQGLLLERPQAQGTIIISGGYFPGRKEGMSTFLWMIPENYNILFFDARGHGASEGKMFIRNYGRYEYRDILGAIKFIHNRHKNLPIILHGCCSGAFNAANALIKLQEYDLINHFHVKGLVFDSGWSSIEDAVNNVPYAELNKLLMYKLNSNKNQSVDGVQRSNAYQTFFYLGSLVITGFKTMLLDTVQETARQTDLSNKIHNLHVPIFYIHCQDDGHAPCLPVQKMAARTADHRSWWIAAGESKHAEHHLKFTDQYTQRMADFFNYCLNK